MQIQLILTDNCNSCAQTRMLWEVVCDEFKVKLTVLDLRSRAGTELARSSSLKTFPALLIEGKVRMVGLPGIQMARDLLESEITQKQESASD